MGYDHGNHLDINFKDREFTVFYRFLSKLATLERLEAFPVPIPGCHEKFRWAIGTKFYENKMELLPVNPSTLGVNFYQAPLISSRPAGVCLRFHPGKETETLPDIWGTECRLFISERVKSVIESVDSMVHEYIPIQWIDAQNNPIATEQNYYWFNQRRFLSIKPSDRVAAHEELGFFTLSEAEGFLARVIDTPSLRESLEVLPIWQHFRQGIEGHGKYRCILYMSQTLVDALREQNVNGLELFSQKYGRFEESLCAV